MDAINWIVNLCYYLLSAFVAFVLIRNIFKSKKAQEIILYSVMLIPFILRVIHIK